MTEEPTRKIEFVITNGPSKYDLQNALFYGKATDETQSQPLVQVDVARECTHGGGVIKKFELQVQSVERADGSGESWNIRGRAEYATFTAYFRTDTRKGRLTWEPDIVHTYRPR